MPRSQVEVPVDREHGQVMVDTELREQGVDSAQLHAGASASVAKRCSLDMIVPIRYKKGKGRKAIDDVLPRPRTGKALKEFLKDDPGCHDQVIAFQGAS